MKRFVCMIGMAGLTAACTAGPSGRVVVDPAVAAAASAPAVTPVVTAPAELLSAELRHALEMVDSDDAGQRAAAIGVIRQTMDETAGAAASPANRLLQEELRALVGTTDVEARSRAVALLDFSQGMAKFTAEITALPQEQQQGILDWGFSDEGVSVVGNAYSAVVARRVEAARELANLRGRNADWMLGRLVADEDREVSLNAMDVIGNRAVTAELVDAIFDKAVVFGLRQYGVAMGEQGSRATAVGMNIHGHVVTVYAGAADQARGNDGDIATEILMAWNSPLVGKRLDAFFADAGKLPVGNLMNLMQMISGSNGIPAGGNIANLLNVYKSKGFIRLAAREAFGELHSSGSISMNGMAFWWSNRTDAMGLLIEATGQKAGDYGLMRLAQYGNRWVVRGGSPEEERVKGKLAGWWKENSGKYEEAATAPK